MSLRENEPFVSSLYLNLTITEIGTHYFKLIQSCGRYKLWYNVHLPSLIDSLDSEVLIKPLHTKLIYRKIKIILIGLKRQ